MHNSELLRRLRMSFEERGRPRVAILARAIARGDLPPDTDLERAAELFMAPIVQRSMVATERMDRREFRQMLKSFSLVFAAHIATP